MFAVSTIIKPNGNPEKILFDTQTTLPLLYPLLYAIDRLSIRSTSTQESALQAVKYFYDFWLQKYGVTFCYSFYHSGHNPAIAMDEIDNFFQYLINERFYEPNVIALGDTSKSNVYTHAQRVHAVNRFIKYLINEYVTGYYRDGEPEEIQRHAKRLRDALKFKVEGFKSLSKNRKTGQGDTHQGFKSLSEEMLLSVYKILIPTSQKKHNPLNPFTSAPLQFRNYLIFRILINYGLRVGELMLLELGSIKPNIEGTKYSIIVTTLDDDVEDPRGRSPSIKTAHSHRVLELDHQDYKFLQLYIDKLRPKVKHNFIFTSLRSPYPPLSYQAIYEIFQTIDRVMTKQFPHFKNPARFDSIEKLTPNVTRHTWAYLTLERLYTKRYKKTVNSASLAQIDFSIKGIMEDAKSALRVLGGWSPSSRMPDRYAKRFIHENVNKARHELIIRDQEINSFDQDLEGLFDGIKN